MFPDHRKEWAIACRICTEMVRIPLEIEEKHRVP